MERAAVNLRAAVVDVAVVNKCLTYEHIKTKIERRNLNTYISVNSAYIYVLVSSQDWTESSSTEDSVHYKKKN